jgi:hypothetical protein
LGGAGCGIHAEANDTADKDIAGNPSSARVGCLVCHVNFNRSAASLCYIHNKLRPTGHLDGAWCAAATEPVARLHLRTCWFSFDFQYIVGAPSDGRAVRQEHHSDKSEGRFVSFHGQTFVVCGKNRQVLMER